MRGEMKMKIPSLVWKTGLIAILGFAATAIAADSATITVKGFVLDSACAFTKDLKKPISKECAVACAKAGSALVILAEDGTIYWPIADTTPSSGQNTKLLPFAGDKVTVSGKVYDRGGSKALVIAKIEAQK
jgi:type 1 fimbria pilin